MGKENWDAQNWSDGGSNQEPKRWQELLAGYVLGDLSSEEMEQVQQYLVQHPEAQTEVEELRATLNLLPLSLPEDEGPPETVRSRLRQSAAATVSEPDAAAKSSPLSPVSSPAVSSASVLSASVPSLDDYRTRKRLERWKNWGLGLGSVAAASVIGFLSLQNHQLHEELMLTRRQNEAVLATVRAQLGDAELERDRYQEMIAMLRQPNNRLLPISGSGYMEVSSGSLVIAPRKNWSVLTLQNLPDPPKGKAYQLWAMADGRKVYCVEFLPDAEGKVLVEVPVDQWGNTPMVAITLEDAGTIPTEASEVIMDSPTI